MKLIKRLVALTPTLGEKLRIAGMDDDTELFMRKTLFTAGYLAIGVEFVVGAFVWQFGANPLFLLMGFGIFPFFFMYFLRYPDVKATIKGRDLNREIIDATRYLIIEIESGIPLYESMEGVRDNFDHIGELFRKILSDVNTGTRIEDAITNAVKYAPSDQVRRVLWQILNSLETGADVSVALKEIISQISREHLVQIRGYGRKLNPLAMFYMIIAVIIPSLGVTMMTVLSSFASIQIDLYVLFALAGFLGFIQFMFLAIIKSSRPAVNM